MKGKIALVLGAAALLVASCVDPENTDRDSPIRIQHALAMEATQEGGGACATTDVRVTGGSVDLDVTNTHLVTFQVTNYLDLSSEESVSFRGAPLSGGERNEFYDREIIYSYSAPNMTFETERLPRHLVLTSETPNIRWTINMLTTK